MPPVPNLSIELVAIGLAIGALYESSRLGTHQLATTLVAMLFGLIVEVLFVTQYVGYVYGDFLLELPVGKASVPIWVAMGWGAIIFAAMRAGDRLGLSWWQAPAFDALAAMTLDLALDPIAQAYGWWSWVRPVDDKHFDVPFDNYIGWLMIVGLYSLAIRAGRHFTDIEQPGWTVGVPVLSLAAAAGGVFGCQQVLDRALYPWLGEPLTWLFLVTPLGWFVFISTLLTDPERPVESRSWYLVAIPACLGVLLTILSIWTEASELLIHTPLAAVLAVVMMGWPWATSRATTC